MENHESAVGGSAPDDDADHQCVEGRDGMVKAYGDILSEENGGERGSALHGGEKAKLYYPDLEREEAALQETEVFLGRVFQGKLGMMLNTMVQQKALSREELAELHEILEEAGKGIKD